MSHAGYFPFLLAVPPMVLNILVIVSLLFVAKYALSVVYSFYKFFLRPARNLKRYGPWAIVTGCTDGIGKAICDEFALKGLNLVLISRTPEKLAEQAKALESTYKIQTKTVAVDFSRADPSIYEKIKTAINGLEIGILVNNVGASYDHAEYFLDLTKEKIEQLIRLNVYSTTEMTYLVLPGMVQRKRGAIINVSSASSLVNEPMYAVYSATKAFVNSFSVALHYEYKPMGVHIQCQLPAFVTTKLSKLRSTSFFIVTPRVYAKSFIRAIGYDPIILTYWTHALQFATIVALVPEYIMGRILLSRGKGIRAKAYAKKKQQQ
jgi:17beta-estradiol 17-dehydrogenase / very-long-chain 3-oxoacyl-CoA reductase